MSEQLFHVAAVPFEAARRVSILPAGHRSRRLHGHGFEVILHANQDLAGNAMGIDFDRLEAIWAPMSAEFDHACLNDIPGLENPTSEMLARWIWERLRPVFAQLSVVTVYETATAGCHYDGVHYRIWKEQRFESALQLVQAPEGDRRRRLHGHSYLMRLRQADPANLLLWIREEVAATLPRLDRIDLHGTPGCGAVLCWGASGSALPL